MELMWLYSLCQCILSGFLIATSVRLCIAVRRASAISDVQGGSRGPLPPPRSVSCCLRLCLGWVGVVGGAVGIPVTVLLNLRTQQCLYTCITLVCCPLLTRQFTMFLLMLLTLDEHLQHHLAERYSSVVTRQRALCVALLCWVGSVLCSFAQFITSDVLHTWRSGETTSDASNLEVEGNWTTSFPHLIPTLPPKHHYDRKVIGEYLPYGGFLSKFYVEDMHNFTYAEIHSSHWVVCAPDTILTPQFVVYVHGIAVFFLPLILLLAIYLDLLRMKPKKTPFSHGDPQKHDSRRIRTLALSLSLLVLLCLPLYIIRALLLFNPGTRLPGWAYAVTLFLFQLYSLVPPILFTPLWKQVGEKQSSFPLAAPNLQSVRVALCEAVQAAPWSSAKHSIKAKVRPEV